MDESLIDYSKRVGGDRVKALLDEFCQPFSMHGKSIDIPFVETTEPFCYEPQPFPSLSRTSNQADLAAAQARIQQRIDEALAQNNLTDDQNK